MSAAFERVFGPENVAEKFIRLMTRFPGGRLPLGYEIAIERGASVQVNLVGGGEPQECFANAGRSVLAADHLLYCEGWIASVMCPVAIQHAWCFDRSTGQHVDFTPLEADMEWHHFGVMFSLDGYLSIARRTKRWAVFENLYLWRRSPSFVLKTLRAAVVGPSAATELRLGI